MQMICFGDDAMMLMMVNADVFMAHSAAKSSESSDNQVIQSNQISAGEANHCFSVDND